MQQCHHETNIVIEKYMVRSTFLCCILHYGTHVVGCVWGSFSRCLVRPGTDTWIVFMSDGFLHVEATIFNIYSTTMPFVSYHGQNIAATLNHDNVLACGRIHTSCFREEMFWNVARSNWLIGRKIAGYGATRLPNHELNKLTTVTPYPGHNLAL